MLPMSMISGWAKRDFDFPTIVSIFIGRSGPRRRLNSTCSASVTGLSLRITHTAYRSIVRRNSAMSMSLTLMPEISVKKVMSLHLHVCSLGDAGPALDLALDEGAELLGRVADRLDAELLEPLRGVGLAQELAEVAADPAGELARGAAGGDDAVDAEDVEPAKGFGYRGNLGRRGVALRARHGDGFHLSGLDVAVDAEGRIELQVDAPGHELGIGLCAALEGNVQEIDACVHLEELAGEVHRAAEPRARIGQLTGMLLRQSDQLGDVARLQRRRGRDHDRRHAGHGHRR